MNQTSMLTESSGQIKFDNSYDRWAQNRRTIFNSVGVDGASKSQYIVNAIPDHPSARIKTNFLPKPPLTATGDLQDLASRTQYGSGTAHTKMLSEFLSTNLDFEKDLRKTLAHSFRRKKTVS